MTGTCTYRLDSHMKTITTFSRYWHSLSRLTLNEDILRLCKWLINQRCVYFIYLKNLYLFLYVINISESRYSFFLGIFISISLNIWVYKNPCYFHFYVRFLTKYISNSLSLFWFTLMINSSSSNTMIQIGNLDLGHLIDTLNYLATPTPKSSRFLITFSWIM